MLDTNKNNNTVAQQPITYPFTNVQIAPNGIVISVVYSPTINMNVVLDDATCDQVVKLWLQQKKQGRDITRAIQHVQKERLA
jgi:hypothetical protein